MCELQLIPKNLKTKTADNCCNDLFIKIIFIFSLSLNLIDKNEPFV